LHFEVDARISPQGAVSKELPATLISTEMYEFKREQQPLVLCLTNQPVAEEAYGLNAIRRQTMLEATRLRFVLCIIPANGLRRRG
jgi:hypothetical protein